MDGKALVRITAAIFVGIAVTVTAVEMTRKEDRSGSAVPEVAEMSRSPRRESLRHCQVVGEAALRDSDCLRLWAEQRDRFLGSKAPFARSASEPITPQSPDSTVPGVR
ncbi:putative entry exclusion protein TrbK-alt [Mesorhizobium atlanticum]|uniref:Conjugal transfer protein TrbK n=1 Tax=Mesorhizobium atlanticum TaxID=2233532 RepID=A0A330GJ18_9HYPH|nr:putative entry exclusion protein TrbK-alt [Mesorhizobium atlanticum]RAZ72418.1 conjugal transfer protein TrbK [Mesorhizobium atlanticum]